MGGTPSYRSVSDLIAIAITTLLAAVSVLVPAIRETAVGSVLGTLFVLFVPGYALLVVLSNGSGVRSTASEFTRDDRRQRGQTASNDRGPTKSTGTDWTGNAERFVLAVGLSVAVSAVVGLFITVAGGDIGPLSVVLGVGGVTSAFLIVGGYYRITRRQPRTEAPTNGFRVALGNLSSPSTRTDAVLNLVVVISVVFAAASLASIFVLQPNDDAYTSLQLLTRSENNGTLVASGYPTTLEPGGNESVVVGITNKEHRRIEYTLVVQAQRITVANNSTTVRDRTELDRFGFDIGSNRTSYRNYSLPSQRETGPLRFAFLLYRGTPPTDPSAANAYREVYITIDDATGN